MRTIRAYGQKNGLRAAFCAYKRWGVKKERAGKKPVIPLRFSKSGDPNIEQAYATHYVDTKRIDETKAQSIESR